MSLLGRLAQAKRQLIAHLHLDLFAPPEKPLRVRPHRSPERTLRGKQHNAHTDSLPSVEQLYLLFHQFNRELFDGRLPLVTIAYSHRMRCAGSYTPSRRLLLLGSRYHLLYPDDIADTLKHEMIHIVNPTHNRAFKAEAQRIGASLKAKFHPSLQLPARFVYECPACSAQYPRRRRLVMSSCGSCSTGKKFDARFKLRLKSSAHRSDRRSTSRHQN